MTLKLAEEIRCGYTTCDILGDHVSTLWVEVERGRFGRFSYNIIIHSACYGNQQFVGLKRAEAESMLQKWDFMYHTRGAIRAGKKLLAKVSGGYFELPDIFAHLAGWETMASREQGRDMHEEDSVNPYIEMDYHISAATHTYTTSDAADWIPLAGSGGWSYRA